MCGKTRRIAEIIATSKSSLTVEGAHEEKVSFIAISMWKYVSSVLSGRRAYTAGETLVSVSELPMST